MDDGARRPANALFNRVGPAYFDTLGMRVLAGRDFGDGDTRSSPPVAIVSESFARDVARDANPIGQRFWIQATPSAPETAYEIVGVVSDAKYADVHDEFASVAFLAWDQDPRPGPFSQFVIHSAAPPDETAAAVRAAIADVDPRTTVGVGTLGERVRASTLSERLLAALSACFGLLRSRSRARDSTASCRTA